LELSGVKRPLVLLSLDSLSAKSVSLLRKLFPLEFWFINELVLDPLRLSLIGVWLYERAEFGWLQCREGSNRPELLPPGLV